MKNSNKFLGTILLLLVVLGPWPHALAQEPELLPQEQAFKLTAWLDGDALIAEYQIAPGYFMYRERFNFEIEPSNSSPGFGIAEFPAGKIKQDEFFGRVETYRERVRIKLPLQYPAPAAKHFQVIATSQGCADIGVCYPPLKQALAVQAAYSGRITPTAWVAPSIADDQDSGDIAALRTLLTEVTSNLENRSSSVPGSPAESDPLAALQELGAEIGLANDEEILHPDQAFILSARLDANNIVQTNILMADDIYLYREKIKFRLVDGDGHSLGAISVPRGKSKTDEFLGPTEVFYDRVDVSVPIISAPNASSQFALSYQYQGCVENRICYPPVTKYITVDAAQGLLQVANSLDDLGNNPASRPIASSANPIDIAPISEQEQFTQLLQNKSLLIIVGLFYLAGIGLTFTPCVFPMIPILSSIIAGQGASITTRKAFSLSLVYVLAMATTYAIAGAIVGYYGAEFNIQIWFQDPIILGIFAALFVLLSLSMFGFYELQMPSAIQSRLTAISNSQEGGTLVGVGLMGLFSAIIVGPCITAPLVGALIFITQTQDWQLGGLALFALGLGMGTPLLLIGTSAGKLLPRAGTWMNQVKVVFGVVLLGIAIWLLERVLPVAATMGLIAALLIGSAIYLGALDALNETASGWRKLSKSLGVLILIYGVAYLIGAAAGSHDLIQPLRGLSIAQGQSVATERHLEFRQIKGNQGLNVALADAAREQRATMLDFYADWCVACKEMERYAFTHPAVLAALSEVTTLQADVTDNDELDTKLMTSLGIYGPPAILFFDVNGQEIRHRRVVGEMSGEKFAAHVSATFQ